MSKIEKKCRQLVYVFANDLSPMELISKIHNELIQNQERGPEQTFFQRRHAHGQRHMKRCSPSLVIEKHTKTTKRYHLTPVRMASIKDKKINKCW